VEFQDVDILFSSDDGSVRDDDEAVIWVKHLIEASNKIKREPSPGPKLEQWIKDAGVVNVVHRKFRMPINSWPKDPYMKKLGIWNAANVIDGAEGFSLRLMCEVLGWSVEEVQVFLAGVRKRVVSQDWHGYYW